jgi:hypothetical protein
MPRTPGTRTCGDCRYWSEMIAMATEGAVKALCLATHGPKSQTYTAPADCCAVFARNTLGPIDGPPDFGASVRDAYARQPDAE